MADLSNIDLARFVSEMASDDCDYFVRVDIPAPGTIIPNTDESPVQSLGAAAVFAALRSAQITPETNVQVRVWMRSDDIAQLVFDRVLGYDSIPPALSALAAGDFDPPSRLTDDNHAARAEMGGPFASDLTLLALTKERSEWGQR